MYIVIGKKVTALATIHNIYIYIYIYGNFYSTLEKFEYTGTSIFKLIVDVRFVHIIKLFTRKYNMIVSTGSCVYLKHFNVVYHIKCLGINCLFV